MKKIITYTEGRKEWRHDLVWFGLGWFDLNMKLLQNVKFARRIVEGAEVENDE